VTPTLQSELKQKKGFVSREEEAFISVLLTADVFSNSFAELLKESGLSPTQYNVLRILRGAGRVGLACGEISERMITRDPDMTRLLDRIEKKGFVTRSRDEKDRRVVLASITKEGLNALKALDKPVSSFHEVNLGHMAERDLVKLVELLESARND
jgi:DNA-binding MarR family transcriptional regulator